MNYRVVIDSCGEIPFELRDDEHFVSVPLTLTVNNVDIVDDGHMDQLEIIRRIAEDPNCPKTACPSPQAFCQAMDCGAEHIYVVTLSANLSGSYQSAVIAMNMYLEDHPDAKVHVFNSVSASIGETLALLKVKELEESGVPFEEIVEKTEEFILSKMTLFVLDNLETLRKNGRLSGMKAIAAAVLKIKPICYGTKEGTIGQLDQARGMNKALVKMVNYVVEHVEDAENRILMISHCNCPERAEIVKSEIQKRIKIKDVIVLPTGGVSTIYANDGGIILAI